MRTVYLVSGARTAVGDFGGALKDTPPADLAALVATEALRRSGAPADAVGTAVFGQVVHTEPSDPYLARIAAVRAGIPVETPAMAVNRLCGSGLQAILTAAQSILLGDAEIALAGGAESMSRMPFIAPAMRFGARLGNSTMQDMVLGALTDPFKTIHMGITAENVAARYDISRAEQDDVAFESHRRASSAIREGRFAAQILPVEVKKGRKIAMFAEDEHVRHDATREDFDGLRTAFQKDGTVTAGNASGLNDGAAAVILASEEAVRTHGLTPMARLASWGNAGVDPDFMGIGPVPATRLALSRAGLSVADLAVIESNEAFAAQACAVTRLLELDPARVNPNGSGISIGHPIGATGAINTIKLAYELNRTGGRYGLVTMCIGGGQGIAAVFERV
ncbi:beta-ketothiolase BktB [Acetobacteraceae bacterium KSS8]|uniref:Beta-ketothiolase BktB n=2 Tax=Endosaccharibacter trunci TaxID=2812733 RepID=A0ABT1WAX2_9PROT|nr:beta-ketothiolase BktB [Acetobacteraceae bacterium KSS8]